MKNQKITAEYAIGKLRGQIERFGAITKNQAGTEIASSSNSIRRREGRAAKIQLRVAQLVAMDDAAMLSDLSARTSIVREWTNEMGIGRAGLDTDWAHIATMISLGRNYVLSDGVVCEKI